MVHVWQTHQGMQIFAVRQMWSEGGHVEDGEMADSIILSWLRNTEAGGSPPNHSGGALKPLAIDWGPGCTFVSVFLGSMPPDCLATICLDNSIPSGLLIQFCSAFENLQSCPRQRWVKAEQFPRDGPKSSLALFRTGKPTTRLEKLTDDDMA